MSTSAAEAAIEAQGGDPVIECREICKRPLCLDKLTFTESLSGGIRRPPQKCCGLGPDGEGCNMNVDDSHNCVLCGEHVCSFCIVCNYDKGDGDPDVPKRFAICNNGHDEYLNSNVAI